MSAKLYCKLIVHFKQAIVHFIRAKNGRDYNIRCGNDQGSSKYNVVLMVIMLALLCTFNSADVLCCFVVQCLFVCLLDLGMLYSLSDLANHTARHL